MYEETIVRLAKTRHIVQLMPWSAHPNPTNEGEMTC